MATQFREAQKKVPAHEVKQKEMKNGHYFGGRCPSPLDFGEPIFIISLYFRRYLSLPQALACRLH